MTKQLGKIAILMAGLTAAAIGQAQPQCYKVSGNSGILANTQVFGVDCSHTWQLLNSSGQFPDVFATNPPKLFPPLCFVSDGSIPAKINNQIVNVNTASAWTTDFAPAAFNLGNDNLGTVITEWAISTTNPQGHLQMLGSVFTRDTIDMRTGKEQDVIVAGSQAFKGAKGVVKVESQAQIDPNTQQPTGLIQIVNINGEICLPDQDDWQAGN